MKKTFLILLTLISGLLIVLPNLNYQTILYQGDHGRDLYVFWATANGHTPYQDYWWPYGPLMPYYYAFIFKILGTSIQSILFGKSLLILFAGLFIFLSLATVIPVIFAFIGTLWFWIFSPDFFYTYNHAGGILSLAAIFYFLLRYLKTPEKKFVSLGLLWIFVLGLIKINFGITALFAFIFLVSLKDYASLKVLFSRQWQFTILKTLLTVFALTGAYFLFARGLPVYALRQCFPYASADHPFHAPMGFMIQQWAMLQIAEMTANWPSRLLSILLIVSLIHIMVALKKNIISRKDAAIFFFAVFATIIFYIVNLHEYLVSDVFYRIYWALPFGFLLQFFILGFAAKSFSPKIQTLIIAALASITLFSHQNMITFTNTQKNPVNYLSNEHGRVFSGNTPDWFKTVSQTSEYLKKNIPDSETFLALPYDPLYYFFTQKKSPTRQLIFFDHINIPEIQEKTIIEELKNQNVQFIVLSNRIYSKEEGLGTFGQTYCPLLESYMRNNFEVIAVFGDWEKPSVRDINHSVMILKRK